MYWIMLKTHNSQNKTKVGPGAPEGYVSPGLDATPIMWYDKIGTEETLITKAMPCRIYPKQD